MSEDEIKRLVVKAIDEAQKEVDILDLRNRELEDIGFSSSFHGANFNESDKQALALASAIAKGQIKLMALVLIKLKIAGFFDGQD